MQAVGGSAIKVVSIFAIQKILAVLLGPSGLALVSQFQNFMGAGVALSSAGINTGVTKYTAEYNKYSKTQFLALLGSTKTITLVSSLLVNSLIFIFNHELSNYLFGNQTYAVAIAWSTISIFLFSINELITSFLTGLKEIGKVNIGSIFRALATVLIAGILAYLEGVKGAIFGVMLVQVVSFFVYLYLLARSKGIMLSHFKQPLDRIVSGKLLRYTGVAVVSSIVLPIVNIQIRNHITTHLSLLDAGIWDGLNKLSAGYMGMVSTVISLYYLPRISELQAKGSIVKELKNGVILFAGLIAVGLLIFFVFADFFIELLFSAEFHSMKAILIPFFIGEVFKVIFMVLGIALLAKARVGEYVFLQTLFVVLNYVLAYFLILEFDLIGASYAHLIRTFLRGVVTFVLVYSFLKRYEP